MQARRTALPKREISGGRFFSFLLLHGDGFCQISGLIYVTAACKRHIVRENLQRNDIQAGLQKRMRFRHQQVAIHRFMDLAFQILRRQAEDICAPIKAISEMIAALI